MANPKYNQRLNSLFGDMERIAKQMDDAGEGDRPQKETARPPAANAEDKAAQADGQALDGAVGRRPKGKNGSSNGAAHAQEKNGGSNGTAHANGQNGSSNGSAHPNGKNGSSNGAEHPQGMNGVWAAAGQQNGKNGSPAADPERNGKNGAEGQNGKNGANAPGSNGKDGGANGAQATKAPEIGASPAQPQPAQPKDEWRGYVYSGGELEALQGETLGDLDYSRVISGALNEAGGAAGRVYLEADLQRPRTDAETRLVEEVARCAALQIARLQRMAGAQAAASTGERASDPQPEERSAYAYDQQGVSACASPETEAYDHLEPIRVEGETAGSIRLLSCGSELSDKDRQLIAAVARQAGQQVESLRWLEEQKKSADGDAGAASEENSFQGDVSRELHRQVDSILNHVELMLAGRDGPLSEGMRDNLQVLLQHSQVLVEMIDNLPELQDWMESRHPDDE